MGLGHSVHTHVQTETRFFYPSCPVVGIVNIHAESAIPANPLIVRLTCKESVFIKNGNDGGFHFERETLVVHYPIGHLEGTLNQGMLSIPFNLRLPSDICPSYENIDNHRYRGVIEYSLDAFIEGSTEVESHKKIIWVHSTVNSIVDVPPAIGQRNFYIRNCFCNAGISVAYAEVNRSVSLMDNDLYVSVRVDNKQSRHSISKVKCSLIRFIGLKFRIPFGKSRRLFQDKICSTTHRVKIPAGESDLSERLCGIDFVIKPRSDMLVLTPTVTGKVVECEYNIKVQVYYDEVCGLSTFGMYVPIELHNGTIPINKQFGEAPILPDNWNPVMISDSPLELERSLKKVYDLDRDSFTVSELELSHLR